MRIAYAILAHREPRQVAALVALLTQDSPHAAFVHVDRKSDIGEFHAALPPAAQVVYVRDRRSVRWGGFSMVEATLTLLATALATARYDYVVLLSGADLPVKSRAFIDSYVESHSEALHVRYSPFPHPYWLEGGLPRLHRRHFRDVRPRRLGRLLETAVAPFPRSLPPGLTPYGGSQWIAIPGFVGDYILEFARTQKRAMRFFRHALIPDELVFQTILLASPYRSHVVNRSLTFSDWSAGDGRPAFIRSSQVAGLLDSDWLFARKFDPQVDAGAVAAVLSALA